MGRIDQNDNHRSEDLRRKRTQRSQQRVNAVSSRVINPVNSRPVIVRGKAFGTPIHHQAGTRPRRQYYLTMDQASGAELRLPAIPLVNPGWRLASGLLVILLAFGIFSFWNSPYFQVSGAEVKGVERLSPEEINKTLRLENMSIIEIDPAQIQEELTTTYPELVDVQVQVHLPNFVTVTAVERKPVIAIQKGDQISWVDADGILFPARGDAGALVTVYTEDDLPLLIQPDPDAIATQSASSESDQPVSAKESLKMNATKPVRIDPTLLAAAQELNQTACGHKTGL